MTAADTDETDSALVTSQRGWGVLEGSKECPMSSGNDELLVIASAAS